MSLPAPSPIPLVSILLCALVTAAAAQTAPTGACLLPSGGWCWPLVPATYGDPCECQTDAGPVSGVIQ